MVELLGPAGTLEKLKWAVAYGADAVYFGMKEGSLRSYAGNFTFDEAEEGLKHLHKKGRRGYVTLNIYPFSEEYSKLLTVARDLDEIGVDGIIVADFGLLYELKKLGLRAPLHISTQANTVSYQTVKAYTELGVKRVNLARELSLQQIETIQSAVKPLSIETEVFIHGAVCFSYSGRCAISDYLTGRRANRGECTQPCRWKYYLEEEKRPGEFLPVFEDERGTYLFNSKDLALFPYVGELKDLGVTSFKIEGRMKTVHYLASVISLYRRILDGEQVSGEEALRLLSKVSNRGYSHGFIKGGITPEDYSFGAEASVSDATFVGNICGSGGDCVSILEVRNKIFAGEKLEVLKPDGSIADFVMPSPLVLREGAEVEYVSSSNFVVLPVNFPEYTVLRRINKAD